MLSLKQIRREHYFFGDVRQSTIKPSNWKKETNQVLLNRTHKVLFMRVMLTASGRDIPCRKSVLLQLMFDDISVDL